MELRDYVTLFNKSRQFIILGTLLVVAVTVLYTYFAKTTYDTSVTITVDRSNLTDQKDAPYYLYDDYYALQSSGLFADTVINWMQSPGIVQDVYRRANVGVPSVRTVAQLGKLFTVKKAPPSTVTIIKRTFDPNEGQILLNAANAQLQDLASEANKARATDKFVLRSTAPVSAEVKPFWVLDIALSLIIGLLATTFVVLFRAYLKDNPR